MFRRFDICCDAPPYAVVRACEDCGFLSPLDVRWCHTSRFLNGEGHSKGTFVLRLWHWLCGRGRPEGYNCTCGHPLPDLKEYVFSSLSEKVAGYFLGQCCRCRTIFWDEAVPLPTWVKVDVLRR